ncbi:Ribosomal L1 domain-containing protein 1 [Harpegnathos saltator]|uniref:Ribosomal L1 domain-containing protein 1 n=2 Tax=Harpegnathos saltator TaxID=610380 RepID=E2B9B7_HARSA|nr:Ribosomal L1 domain-containing protein 1 [Harpegnathos saltator]
MAISQKKPSQNKAKRKLEQNLPEKHEEVVGTVLRTKKRKISKEVEHVSEAKEQKTNVPIEKKTKKQNTQETSDKITTVAKNGTKKKKTMTEVKSMELNEKNDKEKDIEAELSKSHMEQCISAMFHLIEEQVQLKNNLTGEVHPIFMQVTCIRIPKVPRRQMRILLPHSIVTSNDEVALFVCDLERGRKKDYEPTVEHYKKILIEQGCTCINEIIPMNRVKTEFDQFELKKKLAASYDYFLVDSRIAGHLSHLLGKEFFKRRKLPTSVRMNNKDLKHEIEHALRKTSMQIHSNGDSHIVQVGNTLMQENEILENILATCKNLSKNYPGGWANIRSLRLKGATTIGLPFYITLRNKNAVKLTVVKPKRPNAYRDVKGELSTFVRDTDITVKPDGEVIVERTTQKRERKFHTSPQI